MQQIPKLTLIIVKTSLNNAPYLEGNTVTKRDILHNFDDLGNFNTDSNQVSPYIAILFH